MVMIMRVVIHQGLIHAAVRLDLQRII